MLLKLTGAALTIGACGFYGLAGARRFNDRVRHLKSVRFALTILEREVTYIHNPLPLALEKVVALAEPPARQLFAETSRCLSLKGDYTAEESWRQGVAALGSASALLPEDLELLNSFAPRLGMSDVDEQIKCFQMLVEELKLQEAKAAQVADSGRRIWSYGGFLLGALIVLLVI